ncbi:hypothetical protein PAMA_002346 [Pampus argenteus]
MPLEPDLILKGKMFFNMLGGVTTSCKHNIDRVLEDCHLNHKFGPVRGSCQSITCLTVTHISGSFVAQAEISSPITDNRFYRLEITRLETRLTRKSTEVQVSFKVDNSSKVSSASEAESVGVGALNSNNGKQVGDEIQSGLRNETRIGNETALNYPNRFKTPGKKYGDISEDNQRRPAANIMLENTRKRATRSAGTTYTENVDRSTTSEDFCDPETVPQNIHTLSKNAGSKTVPDLHESGCISYISKYVSLLTVMCYSRAEEKQQSGGVLCRVILILTKLYDFNLGAVTESSLWRSTDYGSTYTKLNDKVGSRTVLSYLYVCPTNKQKIMMLSDPEVESAVLISSDEGASFEKHLINFNILSLLFHPAQENWILAYSHDSKLYSSMDFGKKWQLVHDNVMPGRFYWAVMGLDRESDVIHIETRIAKGRAQYVKCRAQRCTEANRQYLFPGHVDTNSLVVQDEYVFTQVTKTGRASYFVSYMRESFKRMKLPKYCLPKDMHIISTDEKQVFAAVQEWNQNNTYSLYISDSPGVYFTLSLENLRTSRGTAGNLLVDFYKVEGIHGMYLANKLVDHHIKTFITYNKGQTWALLPAPATNVVGNNLHCILPFCSLHLHLEMSENPYTSGPITSKKSVPGIIVATGNIGTELSSTNLGMFITSDAGNSWRQVRPILVCTLHLLHFLKQMMPSYPKVSVISGVNGFCVHQMQIFDEEHNIWFLDNGGALLAVLHAATPIRHLWISLDEGKKWDRHSFSLAPLYVDGVLMEPESDNHIITFFGHFSHRSEWQLIKIDYKGLFSRRCMDGDYQTWHLHNKGDSLRTSIQLDFGDGIKITYSNLSRTDDGIKHIYRTTGIYRVTASAENSHGSDSSTLFLHITSPVERVYLSAPIVTIRGKEANLTAVVWPSHTRTLTFFWWFNNSSEPIITLDGSISYTFQRDGKNKVTVQVASGSTVMQDSKVITVKEFFRSLLLSFSPVLDEHNPDIPEWREDIGRVVRTALSQVSGVPEDQLLVSLYPGLPTTAELFILPDEHTSNEHKRRSEEALETISDIFVTALNQGLIQFELKADIRIIVYITQQTLAPLVHSNAIHSGSATLMLLTVVFVGLAAFFIYKFKRKIPWIHVQTEDSHEKESEVISTVGQNDNMSKVKLSEFPSQKELMEKELEARSRGGIGRNVERIVTREFPNCTNV